MAFYCGKVAGFAIYHLDKKNKRKTIVKFYIHPLFRGRGVDNAIIEDLKRHHMKQDIPDWKIYVTVSEYDDNAMRFYERHGFGRPKLLENRFGHGINGFRLELDSRNILAARRGSDLTIPSHEEIKTVRVSEDGALAARAMDYLWHFVKYRDLRLGAARGENYYVRKKIGLDEAWDLEQPLECPLTYTSPCPEGPWDFPDRIKVRASDGATHDLFWGVKDEDMPDLSGGKAHYNADLETLVDIDRRNGGILAVYVPLERPVSGKSVRYIKLEALSKEGTTGEYRAYDISSGIGEMPGNELATDPARGIFRSSIVELEAIQGIEKVDNPGKSVTRAFGGLESRVRAPGSGFDELYGCFMNTDDVRSLTRRNAQKLKICVPYGVLKCSPDSLAAFAKMKRLSDAGIKFELVITGAEGNDRFEVERIVSDGKTGKACDTRKGYAPLTALGRARMVRDMFEDLEDNEYMAIITDAVTEVEAHAIEESLVSGGDITERVSVRVPVLPGKEKEAVSLIAILQNWVDELAKGNTSTVSSIAPVPVEMVEEIRKTMSNAWELLSHA
jgi:ribosomal protein S18 acetylase RimI-like enzyme